MFGGLTWILIGALIGYAAAQKTGDPVGKGAIIGALLGPLAFLMLFAKPGPKAAAAMAEAASRRKCPHCDESISGKAKVCPHCQRDIPQAATPLSYGSPVKR